MPLLSGCVSSKILPKPVINSQPDDYDTLYSPFKDYDTSFMNSINKNWDSLLKGQKNGPYRIGKVVLQFHLTDDGHITDMKVVENNAEDTLALICEKAVFAKAPYPRWPEDMIRMVGKNYRVITITFNYR
jgi:hypothetical protein